MPDPDNPRNLSSKYQHESDSHPAIEPMKIIDDGKLLVFHFEVGDCRAFEMIVDSNPKTGELNYRGMKLCRSTK